ncbi:hypothetical protein CHS0354_020391, partial [Potamilus streckersoni]
MKEVVLKYTNDRSIVSVPNIDEKLTVVDHIAKQNYGVQLQKISRRYITILYQ